MNQNDSENHKDRSQKKISRIAHEIIQLEIRDYNAPRIFLQAIVMESDNHRNTSNPAQPLEFDTSHEMLPALIVQRPPPISSTTVKLSVNTDRKFREISDNINLEFSGPVGENLAKFSPDDIKRRDGIEDKLLEILPPEK